VYYAQVSSSGVGAWTETTDYGGTTTTDGSGGTPIFGSSCAIYSGYIYCVGGDTGVSTAHGVWTNAVYYAEVSSSGVGPWSLTTSYPAYVDFESCAIYSGYIYCVPGNLPGNANYVYYASVSSSGVGTWILTTGYPYYTFMPSCAISSGYIYCPGGIDLTYYASVSSSGVGTWILTTGYPIGISELSCATYSGYIYCVAGYIGETGNLYTNAVYYASVSSSGVGSWASTSPYPISVDNLSCAMYSGYIYCVGGEASGGITSAVYYSPIVTTSTTVSCTPSSFDVGADSSCTATVTDYGGSVSGETITFLRSAGTGSISFPSGDTCTLTLGGTCAAPVTIEGSSSGSVTILATYSGDPNNLGSSGTYTVGVYTSTSTTLSSGSAVIDQSTATGVSVIITESSASDGTTVTLSSTNLGSSQPVGTGSTGLDPQFFDVQVTGISDGTADVYITSSGVTSTSVMEYWFDSQWVSLESQAVTGTTICGVVPVADLGQTPVVIGHDPPPDNDPSSGVCASVSGGNAVISQEATTGVSVVITSSTSPDGTGIALVSQDLGASEPSGTATTDLIKYPISFYDVQILGGSGTGTAMVYITNAGVTSATEMQYWDGTEWVTPAYGVGETTVCAAIPVSALGQTPVVIGHDPPGSDSTTLTCLSVWASPVTIDSGQAATLTATALGGSGSYTFDWYTDSACSVYSGISYSGTTSSYTAPTLTSPPSSDIYCVEVTDSASNTASTTVTVSVESDPTVSVLPAGPLTYDVGQSSSPGLTATVAYAGWNTASVEWYSSTTPSCSSSPTDTGTSGTSFTPSTSTAGTTYYCAVVTDSGILGYSSASSYVEVTVYADPIAIASPSSSFFDVGQTSTNALTATVVYTGPNTATVEWFASSSSSTCTESGSVLASGTSSTLALAPSTSTAGTYYYCAQVTDTGAGLSSYVSSSNVVTVAIFADPTVSVSPVGPLLYNVGQTATGLTATVTYTGPNTASVEWYSSATSTCTGSSKNTGVSGTSFTPSTASAGITWYCAVVSDSGVLSYSSASNAVEVNVDAISTALSANEITTGGSVYDTATLTGVTSNAGGTVTYEYFSNDGACSTTAIQTYTMGVSEGTVPNSPSVTFNTAGLYSWEAIYSGDPSNAGVTSECEPLSVMTPTSAQASAGGGKITDGGNPAYFGFIAFYNPNGNLQGLSVYDFLAPCSTLPSSVFTKSTPGTDMCEVFMIGISPTSLTVTSTSPQACIQLKGGATILVKDETKEKMVGSAAGYSFTIYACAGSSKTTPVGTFGIQIFGPNNWTHSVGYPTRVALSSGLIVVVTQVATTTKVSCTPSTGTVGVSEKCTATVNNVPTFFATLPGGTVTFTGTLPPGMPTSCTLSSGSCSVTWTPASKSEGSYSITTTYGGDSTHAGSTSPATTLKIQTTTTTSISCSPATGSIGTKETCTVTVTNGDSGYTTKASGTITFSGTLPPGMPTSCTLSSGSCSVSWTPASNGSYSIIATYGGDSTHASSASASATLKT
jgi:hypothetical protein